MSDETARWGLTHHVVKPCDDEYCDRHNTYGPCHCGGSEPIRNWEIFRNGACVHQAIETRAEARRMAKQLDEEETRG